MGLLLCTATSLRGHPPKHKEDGAYTISKIRLKFVSPEARALATWLFLECVGRDLQILELFFVCDLLVVMVVAVVVLIVVVALVVVFSVECQW